MKYVTLNNGVHMPVVGYGVYQVAPGECEQCVLDAINVGYRAIDTAQSYGNEAGPGDNFKAVRDWIKQRDPSRLTQYERNNDLADLHSNQYPSVNWVREIAARKLEKPWYISEYAHILCNAMGNLADYWEAIESSDSIIGGGIWEWIHQSYDQQVTLPDGRTVIRQSYGGDHGEFPNDGIFCIKGVNYSDRTPTPLYSEIRKVQQNVGFSLEGESKDGKSIVVAIRNKNLFTNLSDYDGSWEFAEEGNTTVATGNFSVTAGPLETVRLEIPKSHLKLDQVHRDRLYYLNISLKLRDNTNWAEKGYVVATEQLALPENITGFNAKSQLMTLNGETPLEVRNQDGQMLIIGSAFSLCIDKATGGLKNYIVNGQQIIGEKATLHLNSFRAPLANDKWAMNQWLSNGMRNMHHVASPLLVERLDRKCRDVMRLFDACGGDWSQTLYAMLFRALGGNRNREAYLDLASRATYPMVLRERSSMEQVEALLLGTSGLMEGYFFDDYIRRLNDHFRYLARKYDITPMYAGAWESSRIRAQNRPVTRIVQLAAVVAGCDFLFDRVVGAASREALHRLFDVPVSPYWTTHYVPDGTGNRCPHRIGPEKADLLIINAAVPVMFAFGSRTGKESIKASALELLASLPAENNAITRGWSGTGVPVRSALDSQALIQLRNEYCTPHRCAACRIGRSLIKNRR